MTCSNGRNAYTPALFTEDIHLAICFLGGGEEGGDIGFLRYASSDRDRLAAGLGDFRNDFIGALPAGGIVHHYLGSVGGELLGYGRANAFRCPCDDCYFSR